MQRQKTSSAFSEYVGGRHELGQNFLADPALITAIQRLVRTQTQGPIIELGAGDGALTAPLARLGRPVTALELDPRRVRRLQTRFGDAVGAGAGAGVGVDVDVVRADVLRHRFPATPHTIVGNVPFHLTTAIIRKLLSERGWTASVLIVQWEVARRRAGVGGASMLTAAWWPWYEFELVRRIPAAAFRPVPSVDAGLLMMMRRRVPLVEERGRYQAFVKQVFQAPGRGLEEMVGRTGRVRRAELREWVRRERIPARALPKDLVAEDWARLWELARR
ncbi:23S ribosomal RNA methyltransferase Erm [Catenulispora sp. NL8]|uniref:23S ribosomal RNA methyltransferase Erm n=1 Tax=Catenulispora pinistramenti TaxID=2705254 RepID=A0ABS5KV72_9ACTN|nr:23S ribosomal RNA methyltransferase Erm [Catenulispora pinistramenti]MBS2549953.1 23S ribosomal RNA methyltransferase Erm [Catenulispora pinistramenti]